MGRHMASHCARMLPFSSTREAMFKSNFKHVFLMRCQVLQKHREKTKNLYRKLNQPSDSHLIDEESKVIVIVTIRSHGVIQMGR